MDLALGAGRPRPASARRGSAPTATSPASARSRPSADCRRRASRPSASGDGGVMRNAAMARAAAARSASGSIRPRRATPRQAGQGTVGGHRHLQHHAVPPAILWHVGDAVRESPRQGARTRHVRPADADLARVERRDAEDGLRQSCAAGADQAGQAENLAAAHRQRHVVHSGGTARHALRAPARRRRRDGASCARRIVQLVARPSAAPASAGVSSPRRLGAHGVGRRAAR